MRELASRVLLSAATCILINACGTAQVIEPIPTEGRVTSVLARRIDRYSWRLQLSVESVQPPFVRHVWFTVPHSGAMPTPLEDCKEVSASAKYANGVWIQPAGPKWIGYLIFEPDGDHPHLELHCIERSSCGCRHFERSELDGIHAVKQLGTWRKPPNN